jgi:hypothetical protein
MNKVRFSYEKLTVVKERVLDGSRVIKRDNNPKDWREALDRLGSLSDIWDGLHKEDVEVEKFVYILINNPFSVGLSRNDFYRLKILHDDLVKSRDMLKTENRTPLNVSRIETIDRFLSVIKVDLWKRIYTIRTSFSLGDTEFDRMLPEHYTFFIDYVDEMDYLIEFVDWLNKRRTGSIRSHDETKDRDRELLKQVITRGSEIVQYALDEEQEEEEEKFKLLQKFIDENWGRFNDD